MKRFFVNTVIVISVIMIAVSFYGCSDEDCGDCTTDLIMQDITFDDAVLRMYNNIPTIYIANDLGEYTGITYCFICNENKAKDLIKKVKNGGMINVKVRGKMRELREGEPNLSKYDYATKTSTTSCDIEIIKIKKR